MQINIKKLLKTTLVLGIPFGMIFFGAYDAGRVNSDIKELNNAVQKISEDIDRSNRDLTLSFSPGLVSVWENHQVLYEKKLPTLADIKEVDSSFILTFRSFLRIERVVRVNRNTEDKNIQ